MSASNRKLLLEYLVDRSKPLNEILDALSEFDFDSEPLVALKGEHVIKLLSDYVAGKIDESMVERWADAIEVRDDLYYEAEDGDDLKAIIFDLANPLLSGPLTTKEASRMMSELRCQFTKFTK